MRSLGHECQDLLSPCNGMHVVYSLIWKTFFLGNGVRTHVYSKGKIPSTRGIEEGRTGDTASCTTASPTHYWLSCLPPPPFPPVWFQFEWPWFSLEVTESWESQNLCSRCVEKFHEAAQVFMIDYVKMTVKKSFIANVDHLSICCSCSSLSCFAANKK